MQRRYAMLLDFLKKKSAKPADANGAPSVEDSIEEAAQQHYGKESKLDVAAQAVMVEDLRALAREDRKNVRDYRMKLKSQLGTTEGGDEDGDLIVADNITVTQRGAANQLGSLAKGALLATGLLAGGGGGALGIASLLGAFQKTTTTPTVETPSFRYKVRIGFRDGKPFKELLDESGKLIKELE